MKRITKPSGWCAAAIACVAWTGIANAQTSTELQPSWTYASGSSGWVPDTVAIGNEGTRVFSAFGTFGSSSRLFSESSTIIASDIQTQLSYHHRVASSIECERRAWLHYNAPDAFSSATPELRIYSEEDASAEQTYTFPFGVQQQRFGGVGISEDGSRVVSYVYDFMSGDTMVVVFDGAGAAPAITMQVPTFLEPSAARFSADGSTLYLATGTRTFLVDLDSGQMTHSQYNTFSAGMGHALSPDGQLYARGTSGTGMKLFRKEQSGQTEIFSHTVTGTYSCSRIAFSADGSRLAATFDAYIGLGTKLMVLDLTGSSPTVAYEHELPVQSDHSFVTSGLELNRDGSRVFVGTWGDAGGPVPELLVFGDSGAGSWSLTHVGNLPGSVRDLDVDPDGDRLVVASKSVHASQLGGGGRFDHYVLPDASGIRLIGTPTAGGSVQVRVACEPGSTGLLLMNDQLAATPNSYGTVGTLYLERNGLEFSNRTADGGQGELAFTLDLSNAQQGDVVHVQGLTLGPRRLTPGSLTIEVQ